MMKGLPYSSNARDIIPVSGGVVAPTALCQQQWVTPQSDQSSWQPESAADKVSSNAQVHICEAAIR